MYVSPNAKKRRVSNREEESRFVESWKPAVKIREGTALEWFEERLVSCVGFVYPIQGTNGWVTKNNIDERLVYTAVVSPRRSRLKSFTYASHPTWRGQKSTTAPLHHYHKSTMVFGPREDFFKRDQTKLKMTSET